jgi:hypothetical protein
MACPKPGETGEELVLVPPLSALVALAHLDRCGLIWRRFDEDGPEGTS